MRSATIWLSIVAAAGIAATAAVAATPQRIVKDPENRFTIAVPSTWNVQTSTGARTPAVTAKSPTPPAPGQPPDSVEVVTQDLFTPLSPKACAGEAAQVMRYSIHTWKTLHEGPATLAGLPAYSRSYIWRTAAGQPRLSVQTCVTMGRRAFVVVATTADVPNAVHQDLPMLQQIMATFRPNTANRPSATVPGITPSEGGRQ